MTAGDADAAAAAAQSGGERDAAAHAAHVEAMQARRDAAGDIADSSGSVESSAVGWTGRHVQ
jgi:hypothetical protein